MKFLGKLVDKETQGFGWLMYENKGKMFYLTNDLAIDADLFVVVLFFVLIFICNFFFHF